MKILALEFSSARRSAAAAEAGKDFAVLAEAVEMNFRGVTGMELIERALREAGWGAAEIEGIAVGLGPGSYAGIRSAIAIAQGWQLGRGVRLAGISSMEVLAREAWTGGVRGEASLVADAQRGEIYEGQYLLDETGPRETAPLHIIPASGLTAGRRVLGPESAKLVPGSSEMFPTAAALAWLAAGILQESAGKRGEELEPIYLRETSFVKSPPFTRPD